VTTNKGKPRAPRCAITQEGNGGCVMTRLAVALCLVNTGGNDFWAPVRVMLCEKHKETAFEEIKRVFREAVR
jgi:hypothetical protein